MRDCEGHLGNTNRNKYPHKYRDDEGVFKPYELPGGPGNSILYEAPVNSRAVLETRVISAARAAAREKPDPNERKRIAQSEVNDPGAFRGVITAHPETQRIYGVAGVIYHPEGDTSGMRRAAVEPLDRAGRQYLRRFDDDAADPMRVTTWPPRDEDGSDLAMYEGRYQQVRAPKPPPMQKSKDKKKKFFG